MNVFINNVYLKVYLIFKIAYATQGQVKPHRPEDLLRELGPSLKDKWGVLVR